MKINIVAALAGKKRVIGKDGGMPWRIPADLAFFKKTTMGHPIIMGRKTFKSFGGKSLPGRTNIVISKNMGQEANNVSVAHSLADALAKARISPGGDEAFVIGGERVYGEALTQADRLYLTLIWEEIEGDTFFPPYQHIFKHVVSERNEVSNGYAITFQTLER